jgi:hypothetical protein
MLRRPYAVVLALAVGFVPIAPPEHVHEAAAAGNHHSLSHRHVHMHVATHTDAPPHPGSAFDDDDGSIVVLDAVSTESARAFQIAQLPPVSFVQPHVDNHRQPPPAFVERVIHGPPRAPSSPRAPPQLPAL